MIAKTVSLEADKENPMCETQFEEVWAAGMKIAGKGDVAVKNPGDGKGGKYECIVRSQTDSNITYHVKNSAQKGWVCNCQMWKDGRKVCKHITAAFIHISSKDPKSTNRNDNYGGQDLEVPPPLWCHHCGGTECTKKEERPLSKMQHTAIGDNSSVIFHCNSCDRTFTDRPGFVGKHYSEQVILSVLMSVARKESPREAAKSANEHYNTKVSERSARRWVTEYADMVSSYADGLKMGSQCNVVSLDEKCYKVCGKKWWVYTAICQKSRRIIAIDYANEKLSYDATAFFHTIREKIGAPLLLLSDGLGGYKLGYKNVFKAHPPTTLYIQDVGVNGVHVNNSIHERCNGYLAEHIRLARGFRSSEPGRIKLAIIHLNFLRPHMGLGKDITPAEKSGIHIPGRSKLRTLIQCAAYSAFATPA